MPALSYHFHITWDDVYTMPAYELDAYIDALDELIRQMKKGR